MPNAGGREVEIFDVRRPPRGDQDRVGIRRLMRGSAAPSLKRTPSASSERRTRRGIGVLARERPIDDVTDDHLAPEQRKGLRQFAADRTGTDDEQALRPLGQVENRLVRQEPGLGKARNRRRHRDVRRSRSRRAET
jgi:hypothetical protein